MNQMSRIFSLHRTFISLTAGLALLVLAAGPARGACGSALPRAEALLRGSAQSGDLDLESRYALDEALLEAGRLRAAISTRVAPAAGGRWGGDTLCVTVVLDLETGFPIAHQQQLAGLDLAAAAALTYTVEIELPEETSQIVVIVEEAATGRWGGVFVEAADDPVPPPGPRAVRVAAAQPAWYELTPSRAAAALAPAAAGTLMRIVPPRRQPVTGRTRFYVLLSRTEVERVAFFLDGEEVDERRRKPIVGTVTLADPPRPQTLRAVAYDRRGAVLGEDTLEVNRAGVPFRVEISDLQGDPASGAVEVEAVVSVPAGASLDRVEIYRNETPIETFKAPPFRTRVPTPNASPEDYIRAAAFLADGSSIDTVALLSAPGAVGEVEVNLVETFAVVTDAAGEPIPDLTQQDFTVLYKGVPRQIDTFSYANDVPLLLGLVIDTSGSMALMMHETRKAAARFLQSTVLASDRAFVVDFADRPRLLQDTTGEMTNLLLSLGKLQADGATALYDAVIFSMLQFEQQPGRKALVVLTDGDDRDSSFGPKRCIEYAQQLGVSLYVIGLGELDGLRRSFSKRELRNLTDDTGGGLYFVDSLETLGDAYTRINAELRSQYTLTFYADEDLSDEERRAVTVQVARPGAEVRTVVGARTGGGG